MSDVRPIGVFDSGIGGLTVVREMFKRLPRESVVYFGDTARVPYGSKSAGVVRQFAIEDADFLVRKRVKMVVVACHTASAAALDILRRRFPIPVLGVIEPGVQAALAATRNNRIGVIGTRGTVLSRAYERMLVSKRADVTVVAHACPLLVPLVEEGWLDGEVTRKIVDIYLRPFMENGIDTLILGCTHYPLLKPVIRDYLGQGVRLIDSAEETTQAVADRLRSEGISNKGTKRGGHRFYVSDIPHRFAAIGERCLGRKLGKVEQVHTENRENQNRRTEKFLAKGEILKYI